MKRHVAPKKKSARKSMDLYNGEYDEKTVVVKYRKDRGKERNVSLYIDKRQRCQIQLGSVEATKAC